MMYTVIATITVSLIAMSNVVQSAPSSSPLSDCYHPFMARMDAPTTCATSKDCLNINAVCVYSLKTDTRVCCIPRSDAISPSCPGASTSVSDRMPLLCDPTTSNQIDNGEACPEGYTCTASATDFTRAAGTPSFLCCSN